MLTIIYGDAENSVYNTSVYFKNNYEEEWLESDLAKKMIKDVDDSDVLSGECIMSPVFGQIPPERLFGGVKTLLLMLNEPDRIFNASFEIKIQNGGEVVHSMKELVPIAHKYLTEME